MSAEWIPKYLNRETQVLLDKEMIIAPLDTDEDGYIYCGMVLDDFDDFKVHFKVGQTTEIRRPMPELRRYRNCNKRFTLKGWCPGPLDGDYSAARPEVGEIIPGLKTRFSKKVVRKSHFRNTT